MSDNEEHVAAVAALPMISDVVLSYIAYALDNSNVQYVTNVSVQHFSSDEIVTARDTLWDKIDADHIPKLVKRHNITSRKGMEKTVADIIEALTELSSKERMPNFVVGYDDVGRLPASKPAETCIISICDRLARLEERMKQTEDVSSENHCKVVTMEERLQKMQGPSYAQTAQRMNYMGGPEIRPTGMQRPMQDRRPPYKAPEMLSNTTKPKVMEEFPSIWADERSQQRRSDDREMESGAPRPPPEHQPAKQDGLSKAISLLSIASTKPSLYGDGFTYDKKQRRRRKAVKGSKNASAGAMGLEAAPEPTRDIFVYRLKKKTTVGDVMDYMTRNDMKPSQIDRVSHTDAKFASFRIKVKVSLFGDCPRS